MRFATYEDLIVAHRRGEPVSPSDVRRVLASHEDGAMAGGEAYAEEFMAHIEGELRTAGLLQ